MTGVKLPACTIPLDTVLVSFLAFAEIWPSISNVGSSSAPVGVLRASIRIMEIDYVHYADNQSPDLQEHEPDGG